MQKGLQFTHAANKAEQGERIGAHLTSPLKIQPLRFRSKEKLTAGAHSRRERELTWCYRRAAKHWNVTAPRGDWKSRGNGTDTDQQSTGQRCGRNPSGDMPAKLSIGELPGHKRRYGARGTWVWRTLNAISQAIQHTDSLRA